MLPDTARADIISLKIQNNDTWNTCTHCLTEWKDPVPTPTLLHRYTLCDACRRHGTLHEVRS